MRSPPTTHLDAGMMSSIVMVKARGEVVKMLPELEVLKVRFDQPCDALWDLEEVESFLQGLVRRRPKDICEIQDHHVEVFLFLLSSLDLVPDDICMFQTS